MMRKDVAPNGDGSLYDAFLDEQGNAAPRGTWATIVHKASQYRMTTLSLAVVACVAVLGGAFVWGEQTLEVLGLAEPRPDYMIKGHVKHLDCDHAEPQSPRDLTANAVGHKAWRVEPLDVETVSRLVHTTTLFYHGAEHKSDEYQDEHHDHDGFACNAAAIAKVTDTQKKHFKFQHCRDVKVGHTYEIQWYYSSGGKGLHKEIDGVFERQQNPYVAAQAQVYVIVNDEAYQSNSSLAWGWNSKIVQDAVRYSGSSTDNKYNNGDHCSPVSVSWHVDKQCHFLSAKSFDRMCEDLNKKLNGKHIDAKKPRKIVEAKYASTQVHPLYV